MPISSLISTQQQVDEFSDQIQQDEVLEITVEIKESQWRISKKSKIMTWKLLEQAGLSHNRDYLHTSTHIHHIILMAAQLDHIHLLQHTPSQVQDKVESYYFHQHQVFQARQV